MKGKNLLLLIGAGAVAVGAYYLFFKKPRKGGKEQKSNASGTMRTVGPCSGSQATAEKCQTYCEDTLGGTYNSDNRSCTYSGTAAPGPFGMRVITGRRIVTTR